MSVVFDKINNIFLLETDKSTYQMRINEIGILEHLYYGAKVYKSDMSYLIIDCDRGFSGNPYELKDHRGISMDTRPNEYSVAGIGDYRVNALSVVNVDGSRSIDLRYKKHCIIEGKYRLKGLPYVRENGSKVQTLVITLEDRLLGIEVELYYGVFEDKDIITRSVVISNKNSGTVKLQKIASACLDFSYGQYDIIHFYGRHCMERMVERIPVTNNIQVVASGRGMSSHHHNPFVILCDKSANEDTGAAYGVMLMYSGNHRTEIEMDQTGGVRIVTGINNEKFEWNLGVNEKFYAPETILSFSEDGLNGLSQNYHRILRENVCDPKYQKIKRPILINNWEATYFDFDKTKLLTLAKEAKQLGIEMLVLDDGWFGKRNDDNRGLGDWVVNEEKLGGTLSNLVDEINKIGLKFGLWIEPEMVNEDSDLYRKHPEWALREPEREPIVSRNQLVLDMSREDVVEYLFECLDKVIKSANIEYIKWDFNRSVSNVFSNYHNLEKQGEISHRFVLGTYELMDRLLKANPKIMIEGCAGGGGRYDAGILFYSTQIWCSDDTDAIERIKIQKGTSYGYPVSTMGSHVSASPNHQTMRTTPLHTRGVVAMSGTFGYELDIAKLSNAEKEEIKSQIADFHKYYWLIQNGKYYRLTDEHTEAYYTAWEFVDESQKEVLLNLVVTHVQANGKYPFVKLKGLNPDSMYVEESSGKKYTGIALMKGGYSFGIIQGDYPAMQLHFVVE
ncbi:MAG: alpha-galactosidase [Lachnospiraceae bacterium]|nr:alpha-galactosidase [Lachnospiraceae bacterium]